RSHQVRQPRLRQHARRHSHCASPADGGGGDRRQESLAPKRERATGVNDLRQSRRHEMMNGSKSYSPADIGRTTSRGHSRCAVRWSLPPHPGPLPWGEGEPFSTRRTIQTSGLSTARCALFPLPGERARVRGNAANDPPAYGSITRTVELDESSGGAGGFLK